MSRLPWPAENKATAIEMRARGATYDEIAAVIGLSAKRVSDWLRRRQRAAIAAERQRRAAAKPPPAPRPPPEEPFIRPPSIERLRAGR